MLTIVGDVIEYDGKPFAIITAPLSGFRMDAIDWLNTRPVRRKPNLPMKPDDTNNYVVAPDGSIVKW